MNQFWKWVSNPEEVLKTVLALIIAGSFLLICWLFFSGAIHG